MAINSQNEACRGLQRIVSQLELEVAEADGSLEDDEDYPRCIEQVSAIIDRCRQQLSCR